MARSNRFRSIQRGNTTRRRTGWDGGPNGILSPASSAVSLFPVGVVTTADGFTLIRTRGELLLRLLSSSVAQGGFQWAFGIGIVSDKAFAVGATAVPGPLTEIGWEGWMVHAQGAIKSSGPVSVDVTTAVDLVQRVPIDSKAMRKFNTDETLVAVLETVEVGTATMHAELRTRLLSKLP